MSAPISAPDPRLERRPLPAPPATWDTPDERAPEIGLPRCLDCAALPAPCARCLDPWWKKYPIIKVREGVLSREDGARVEPAALERMRRWAAEREGTK